MATLLRADGTRAEVKPRHKHWTLKEWQDCVGGYVQQGITTDGRMMLMNEDGKILDLPVNRAATALYVYGRHDFIVGDALIITRKEFMEAKG